jgi:hypothetical protein
VAQTVTGVIAVSVDFIYEKLIFINMLEQ